MRAVACIAALGVALGPSAASAALPSIWIDVAGGAPAQDVSGNGSFSGPNPSGETFWSLDQDQPIAEGGNELGRLDAWSVTATASSITNNVNLTNSTASEHVYAARVTLPVGAVGYDGIRASSVGVTLTDGNGDGALRLASDGALPFYRGQVDSATLLSLDPGTPLGPADCAPQAHQRGCSATGSQGVVALASVAGVANEIALVLRFALGPGDSVGITSRFEIASGVAAASVTTSETSGPQRGAESSPLAASVSALRPGCHAPTAPEPGTNLRCYVTGNVDITNTFAFDIAYVTTWHLDAPSLDYHSVAASSVGVALIDNDGDGSVSLARDGSHPFYEARSNAVPLLALDPGLPLVAADCAPAASAPGCSASGSDGIGTLAASGTASDLEITLRFVLSAGDTVGITSRFELLPEPGSAGSLGCGVALLALLAGRLPARGRR